VNVSEDGDPQANRRRFWSIAKMAMWASVGLLIYIGIYACLFAIDVSQRHFYEKNVASQVHGPLGPIFRDWIGDYVSDRGFGRAILAIFYPCNGMWIRYVMQPGDRNGIDINRW
jgi:hypothetical protein